MKAVMTVELGAATVKDVPIPKTEPGYILAKVQVVAVNPTDWKHLHFQRVFSPECTCGCDFAGVVEEIGPGISKKWKKGDRIAGFAHGVNPSRPEEGAFAEYALIKGDAAIKVLDNVSLEEAATLPIGLITNGLILYQNMHFPLPDAPRGTEKRPPFLVYGASSATGTLAVQFAKLSGYNVIAVCSERNFSFVRDLGASTTFNYRDGDCGKKIREYTSNHLYLGLDCIADETSTSTICDAVSTEGGIVGSTGAAECSRKDIARKFALGYVYKGEEFLREGKPVPADLAAFEFTVDFLILCEGLLASGRLLPHPHKLGADGLEGVIEGMEQLRKGEVSGVKLVHRIA